MTTVPLPNPEIRNQASLSDALRQRRSVRAYSGQALTLQQVAQLLWAAQGHNDPSGLRTAPSAGALYPLELLVAAGDVAGLDPGVYRYRPQQHALEMLHPGDRRDRSRSGQGEKAYYHLVLLARDRERGAALGEIRRRRRALGRRPHRILVVLDHEDDRQVPEFRHVERFVDLALVGGAIAEIGEGHPVVAEVLVGEGEARPDRHLRADDAVAAVEMLLFREHVHRAALALGIAALAARELGHDALGVHAAGQHVAVVAVAGDDAVAIARGGLHADDDGFLFFQGRKTSEVKIPQPDREGDGKITQDALNEGLSAQDILYKGLMPGMDHVSKEFKKGDMFVPEVMRSARTMLNSMVILKPLLSETGAKMVGKVLLGTVKGDLHDIGKNLVGMMCEGAGFEIVDIGFNADPEKFVEAIKEHQPDVVGMSALLTTTMRAMESTIKVLEEAGISTDGLRSKSVQEFMGREFDYVITVCDSARRNCPVFPGRGDRFHWGYDDPSAARGTEEERLAAFRRVFTAISQRIDLFMNATDKRTTADPD